MIGSMQANFPETLWKCSDFFQALVQTSVRSKASLVLNHLTVISTLKWLPIQGYKIGVQIDSQLNWDKHIDTIKTKANQALELIKYRKKYLPSDVLSKMYRGLVKPHLSYSCSIWGCYSESKIDFLQKIQNRAVRIVTSSSCDVSAAPIIHNLCWSNISNFARKETATLTYKSLNSLAQDYLRKLFAKCLDDRERSLRPSETDLKAFRYRW